MRTPDGHGRLELTKFRNPKLVEIEPAIAPPNTLGLRSVMEDKQDAVEDPAMILRGPAVPPRGRQQRLQESPLLIGELVATRNDHTADLQQPRVAPQYGSDPSAASGFADTA
jgi:hypothetical protein